MGGNHHNLGFKYLKCTIFSFHHPNVAAVVIVVSLGALHASPGERSTLVQRGLRLDLEGPVASGVHHAHVHWLVLLLRCADVPVREADRPEGGDVHTAELGEEQEPHHVAVCADVLQSAFVRHSLKR